MALKGNNMHSQLLIGNIRQYNNINSIFTLSDNLWLGNSNIKTIYKYLLVKSNKYLLLSK